MPTWIDRHGLRLAAALALVLLAFGIGLRMAWDEPQALWPWLAASLLLAIPVLWQVPAPAAARCCDGACRGEAPAWAALGLALVLMALAFSPLGHADFGAQRWLGSETLHLRSGLWAGLLMLGFLAWLAEREAPGPIRQFAAAVGLVAFLLACVAQPDFLSTMLFGMAALLVAWRARNRMRHWVPATLLGGAALVAMAVLNRPTTLRRMLAWLGVGEERPFHTGFVAGAIRRAFAEAGWWGFPGALREAPLGGAMDVMTEWHALPYLSLWLGNVVAVLAVVALAAICFLLLRAVGRLPPGPSQRILHGAAWVFVLAQLLAVAGPLGWLPMAGHYGLAFIGAGEASVFGMLLLAATAAFASRCSRS